jgi:CBS domain-containing protein
MQVRDVMTSVPETIPPDTVLREAAARMQALHVGALPVCAGGQVIGVLSDRGVAEQAVAWGRDPFAGRVRDAMSPDVACCPDYLSVQEAASLMRSRQVRWLVVLDLSRRPAGMVSLADLAVGGRQHAGQAPEKTDVRGQPAPPPAASGKSGDQSQRLQEALPAIKDAAAKVGGFRHLSEIAKTLDETNE